MSEPKPPLITPLRAILFIAGCAALATIAIVATSEPEEPTPAIEEHADAASERPAQSPRSIAVKQGALPPPLPRPQPGEAPEEDLWTMVPDEHHLREIQQADFEREGGVASPGTDPEGARREVDDDDWPDAFAEELRAGLNDTVLTGGVEVDRLECQRGRCLIELQYEGMLMALERIGAIRQWLTERVRCRGYTEGPVQEDFPSAPSSQQIWILCGEPTPSR